MASLTEVVFIERDDPQDRMRAARRVVAGPPWRVAVHIGPALHAGDFADAAALHAAVYAAVCAPIETGGELV